VHYVAPLTPLANSLFLPASTPRAPYSTLTCRETIGQQQIEFGTHLALLRVGNAAESYVLAAVRTRTDVTRAGETTAAKAGNVHKLVPPLSQLTSRRCA
jgi:hypothetical protein